MGIGGIALRKARIPETVKKLAQIREDKGAKGLIKWESTRDSKLEVRRGYVDYLVELVAAGKVHFHLRFAPFSLYEHPGPRRIYDTVSKMYYQLLLHRTVRNYGSQCKIFVRPDDGPCTAELEQFKDALHVEGQLRYRTKPDCIDSIVCINSRSRPAPPASAPCSCCGSRSYRRQGPAGGRYRFRPPRPPCRGRPSGQACLPA
jgi:hypothetical protein